MQPRPRRALIVTDVHLVAWALSSAFAHAGFVALTAETPDGACDALRTVDGIDLVVISLSLGSAKVSETLCTLSREWPDTPAVLLAAEPDTSFPEHRDGTLVLQLPFSVDDVVGAAERLLGRNSGATSAAEAASSPAQHWDA